ncbi:MutS-related protein [Mediterraneibacter sp. ICN-202921]|uniref:MutS-related protein n=1 Tax=Mediterraneibacter sp. ICN-202921 TaxID=3134657 RepID=UPI0026AF75FB
MVGILTAAGIFLFALSISLLNRRAVRKKQKIYLEEKFGTVPPDIEFNENIRNYYETFVDTPGVDDITWNDLSMDAVFCRINQCDTSAGEELLYAQLRKGQLSDTEYRQLERKIKAAEKEEDRLDIERELMKIGKYRGSYFIPSYMDALEEYRMKHTWLYQTLQILFFAALIFFFIIPGTVTSTLLCTVFGVNLVLYAVLKMRYEVELQMVGTAVDMLRHGRQLVKKEVVADLYPELKKSLRALQNVTRSVTLLQSQKNGGFSGDVFGILLDYILGVTMWQIVTYNKVIKKLCKDIEDYMIVYRSIGELDMAVSIASFRESVPWYCIPEFQDKKIIDMKEIYHPLLEQPVENSLFLERGCIITGSNASGKSTFIKAVAVCAILAQSIHTCTAREMKLPKCQVITSMSVKDDLFAGESYFIREIKYLKRILDSLSEEKTTLCVVDEILRGTNTGERIRASMAILKYLYDKNCIAFVATHDRELTELLADEYENYHFSEEIGDEDIYFSYKIQKGPSVSQNAIKLLEFADFPKEIIEKAKEVIG